VIYIKCLRISIQRAYKLACMSYLSPRGVKYVIDDRLPPAVQVYEMSDGSRSVLWSPGSCS
jgi:hypothetical protein